jgi:branched-subunit amino acid transport protein
MSAWITLVVASILTLALRAGPSLLSDGIAVPTALRRANRFTAPALMGALASRGVATHAATGGLPVLAAVAVAVAVAARTRSMTATIAAGTAGYLIAVAMVG